MSKKEHIPIPPPAPLPLPEAIDVQSLKDAYEKGEIDLICVMGPTASGKTHLAVQLARAFNKLCAEPGSITQAAEILSADSRQVYKDMDIGTGKDLDEYCEIPYHLIDIVPAGFRYDICRYQRDFSAAYKDCRERKVIPILCGGSGLYVEAVTKPEYKMKDNEGMDLCLSRKAYYMATILDRETRRARIDKRLIERLDNGMLLEVKSLLDNGVDPEALMAYGLEYRYLTLYLQREIDVDTMVKRLSIAIHQFAKRQMTWLRGMERDGLCIHWVEASCLG